MTDRAELVEKVLDVTIVCAERCRVDANDCPCRVDATAAIDIVLDEAARVVLNWSLPTIQTPSMWLVDKEGIAAAIRALKGKDTD